MCLSRNVYSEFQLLPVLLPGAVLNVVTFLDHISPSRREQNERKRTPDQLSIALEKSMGTVSSLIALYVRDSQLQLMLSSIREERFCAKV